jgi:trans-2,3-dihydro-3-hydroxyanthranilate isomerase
MQRRFVTIDVFTDRAFGGNPLAVVLDAAGLSPAQMQVIAREFGYSETTFVLPPADKANTAQVRIFTPGSEIPFAGHPNVGTALVLARRAASPPARVVFEEEAGLVALEIGLRDGQPANAELTAPRPFAALGEVAAADVAAAVGLTLAEVVTETHRPVVGSVGLPILFAELATRAALRAARPDLERLAALLAGSGAAGVFLYTEQGVEPGCDLSARMFSPLDGIGEDPATGSACVALAALLAGLGRPPDAEMVVRIAQGADMGRPSLLRARAVKRGGAVVSAHVGGSGVEIMQGTLFLAGEA